MRVENFNTVLAARWDFRFRGMNKYQDEILIFYNYQSHTWSFRHSDSCYFVAPSFHHAWHSINQKCTWLNK